MLLISTGPIADSFLPLASEKALAGGYRLIRYRQRRLAPGTRDPAPVSFAQHAADAAALLGHLGVRRAHVAGHSIQRAPSLPSNWPSTAPRLFTRWRCWNRHW